MNTRAVGNGPVPAQAIPDAPKTPCSSEHENASSPRRGTCSRCQRQQEDISVQPSPVCMLEGDGEKTPAGRKAETSHSSIWPGRGSLARDSEAAQKGKSPLLQGGSRHCRASGTCGVARVEQATWSNPFAATTTCKPPPGSSPSAPKAPSWPCRPHTAPVAPRHSHGDALGKLPCALTCGCSGLISAGRSAPTLCQMLQEALLPAEQQPPRQGQKWGTPRHLQQVNIYSGGRTVPGASRQRPQGATTST